MSDAQQQDPDAKGATEDEVERIREIHGDEVLGYDGEAREEHSGQNEPEESDDLRQPLADNAPADLPNRDRDDETA
jgi:hypothetical protein